MIQYGLISLLDAQTIEKTLNLVMNEFQNEVINTCEIGIFNGQTSRGIRDYLKQNNREHTHIAIDNNKDFPVEKPYPECALIIGNSIEVYNRIPDGHLHFLFCDGCHALPYVIADFFCYEDKIKKGGYFLFHDTGEHIGNYKDYQRVGSDSDADMYISCRKALNKIGVLSDELYGWRLLFDEADINNQAGGVTVFKKYMQ